MRELSSHLHGPVSIAPVALALVAVLLAGRWFTAAENLTAALAARKRAAILVIAIGRFSVLWLYPLSRHWKKNFQKLARADIASPS